ncbi:MAG: hypothetical protein WAN65_10770 [Candidatus Sulfotelmatobacter sp.]
MKRLLRTRSVFLAVVLLGIFGMTARNFTDPDVWWHLKAGQFIAEHRSVPNADPFSYTRAGQPWVAHEWLSELFLYELQRATGSTGLILSFAAIVCVAFFLLYLRCGPPSYIAGVATLVAAWSTAPLWGVRPQIISLLLTSLWLLILDRSERYPRVLWWTLPLTLLWVNLHAGFALGLVLSALFLAGGLIERGLGCTPQQSSTRLRIQAWILLLDLLIVPVNPNGLRMFVYPIETLRSAAMQKYIVEWASPNFHRPEYWLFLLLVLTTFAAISWSRVPLRPRDLLLLLVSLYASLGSIRLMHLFALIATPLICQRLGNWPRSVPQALPHPPMCASRALLNALILLAMAAFVGVHATQVAQHEPQAEVQSFPAGAVSYLQAHPVDGPIFNDYDWGGYLIWKLYPSTRVFIDGRADLYATSDASEQDDPSLLDQFAKTYQFKGSWRQSLDRWNIKTALVPTDSALAVGLRRAPGWTVIYEDSQAIILVLAASSARVPTVGLVPSPEDRSVAKLHRGHRRHAINYTSDHFAGYYGGNRGRDKSPEDCASGMHPL